MPVSASLHYLHYDACIHKYLHLHIYAHRALATDPFMPRSRRLLAVPFVGKDVPSRASEFSHPDVVIGMTILAYRYLLISDLNMRVYPCMCAYMCRKVFLVGRVSSATLMLSSA